MSDNLKSQIESLLLVSSKPLNVKKIAEIAGAKSEDIQESINEISRNYEESQSGIRLIINNGQVQLVSAPENSILVQGYLKDEQTGELTNPSLETLTIIGYRQPITKAELEQIRGVNCSLILRNLMIRGLVEAEYSKQKAVTEYNVTLEFLKYLGLNSVKELPDYEKLNSNENLLKLLSQDNYQVEADEDKVVKVEVNAAQPSSYES